MACGKKPTIKVGDIFTSNSGSKAEVVHYENINRVWVQFLDETGYVKYFSGGNLRKGMFKSPFQPIVYGKGYIGVGKFMCYCIESKKVTPAYRAWAGMLMRCYHSETQRKNPAYIGCTVEDYFLNFQNFAEWYYNHPNHIHMLQLDKDILVKGNKKYSRDACCFVPQEVNSFFKRAAHRNELPLGARRLGGRYRSYHNDGNRKVYLGTFDTPKEAHEVYVKAKEKRARELAIKYQDKLDTRVYNILYNWKYEGNGFEY